MGKRKDYSFDLETLGTRYDSYIVSIACAEFDIETSEIRGTFHTGTRCQDDDYHIDVSTVMWWLKQSDKARNQLSGKVSIPLQVALSELSEFLCEEAIVWGNGATFDITLLEYAYHKALKCSPPWKYYNVRDMRTIVDVARTIQHFNPKSIEFEGTKHNALDDAKHQARVISAAYRSLYPF